MGHALKLKKRREPLFSIERVSCGFLLAALGPHFIRAHPGAVSGIAIPTDFGICVFLFTGGQVAFLNSDDI